MLHVECCCNLSKDKMTLAKEQRTGRSPSRQGIFDAPRIVRAAGVLAITYLAVLAPPPELLSPSGYRKTYCRDVAPTPPLQTCYDSEVRFWRATTWGVLYAEAAQPAVGAAVPPPPPDAAPRGGYSQLIKNEIVANLAGIPVELVIKDAWQQLFHKTGKQHWADLLFWITGFLLYNDARKVAIMITRELQLYLYEEAPVNESAWKTTRRQLEQHLREWWLKTPEDPYRSLTSGVWKALVNVYTDLLEPILRGSPKLEELENVLFDPDLKVIRSWTDAAHLNIVRGNESEIVTRVNNLARERPRPKKRENLRMKVDATTGLEKDVGAVDAERTASLDDYTQRKPSSNRAKASSSLQRRHSRKPKAM